MRKPNSIRVSKSLHGFVNYQYFHDLLGDPQLDRFSLTHRHACGLFSVHHALVFLGQGDSLGNVKRLHSRTWDLVHGGLYLEQLRTIIRNAGAKSDFIEEWKLKPIKSWIDRNLAAGHPVIIGDEYSPHWCCLGGKTTNGDYVWADSAESPAIGTSSWDELAVWMERVEKGRDLKYPFQALAVLPGPAMPVSRSIVPWVDGIWGGWSGDPKYARDWSNLLADMSQVFWDAEYVKRGIPAGDFLDEHTPSMVEAVTSLNGWEPSHVWDCANAFRDVAHFHNLVVDPGQETATLARFSLMLQARLAGSG